MTMRFRAIALGMLFLGMSSGSSPAGWGMKELGGAISHSSRVVSDGISDAHLTPVHHSEKYYNDRDTSHLCVESTKQRLVVDDGGTIAPRPQPTPEPVPQPSNVRPQPTPRTPPAMQERLRQQEQAQAIVRGVLQLLSE